MDTHDATHRYLAPKTAETNPLPGATEATPQQHDQLDDIFHLILDKSTSPKFCSCHFSYSGFRTRQVGRPTWYLLRTLSLFSSPGPFSRYRRSSAGFILRKEGACPSDSRATDWSHSFNIRFVVVAQRYQCALNRAKYGEKRTQRGTPSCSGCVLRASEHCVCV
jgi:hypothetical protein